MCCLSLEWKSSLGLPQSVGPELLFPLGSSAIVGRSVRFQQKAPIHCQATKHTVAIGADRLWLDCQSDSAFCLTDSQSDGDVEVSLSYDRASELMPPHFVACNMVCISPTELYNIKHGIVCFSRQIKQCVCLWMEQTYCRSVDVSTQTITVSWPVTVNW